MAVGAAAGLFADWAYATGISESDAISGRTTWLVWVPVGLGAVTLLISGLAWFVGHAFPARLLQAAGSGVLLIPSGIVIVVTEAVQAWLPTWLAPVVTNSDVFAFRAGIGAWIALVVAIGGLAIAATGLPQTAGAPGGGGVRGYVAFVLTIVGATGLMVLRARPFAQVEVTVDDGLTTEIAAAVDGVSGTDVVAAGEAIVAAAEGSTRINLVAGDIPLFGQVTLIATLALVVALFVMLIRPGIGSLITVATASGTLIFTGWILSAIVVTIDTVIPDSWLAVDGYAAVAAETTTSIWWLTLWSMMFTVGVAMVALNLDISGTPPDVVEEQVVADAGRYEWGAY